ncbi:GTP-binding protein, partial [Patescibacteria group bacterium]|nr:GTP-binding protein [Patescibacteria group bacterium]
MDKNKPEVRNVAVIAHVDHGKTTLIDALLKQTHVFRDNEQEMGQERILDTNDLERERGITILAKNCAISYQGVKINIIDTPGHADFSGEVERTLGMANGALLIIDAQEGPMPQTRFVLRKALELNLKIIVVVNKIDKPYARIPFVLKKTENLFLELASRDEQLEFSVLFAVGREGKVFSTLPSNPDLPGNTNPLLDEIINLIPPPQINDKLPFKMIVSSIEYDTHLGRIAVGRIHQGIVEAGKKVVLAGQPSSSFSIEKVLVSEGLEKKEVASVSSGDIVSLAGIKEVKIGQTICEPNDTKPLPAIVIGEPTMHLTLNPNSSPFSGQEGEFTTSRQLESRINLELEKNLSLRVAKLPNSKFKISGRGELHLAVFLENLRREGYEMEVEKPQVIIKEMDGKKYEPVEEVDIIIPKEYVGVINQELGKRFAIMTSMEPINEKEVEFIYRLPTRAII